MTSINQCQPDHPSPRVTEFAVESIDAYTLAQEVVSDLSAIFEALDKLELTGYGNARINRILFHAGSRNTTDWLKLPDEKIDLSNNALDELKELQRRNRDA